MRFPKLHSENGRHTCSQRHLSPLVKRSDGSHTVRMPSMYRQFGFLPFLGSPYLALCPPSRCHFMDSFGSLLPSISAPDAHRVASSVRPDSRATVAPDRDSCPSIGAGRCRYAGRFTSTDLKRAEGQCDQSWVEKTSSGHGRIPIGVR